MDDRGQLENNLEVQLERFVLSHFCKYIQNYVQDSSVIKYNIIHTKMNLTNYGHFKEYFKS